MAAPTDVCQKQCAIIEILVCEKETPGNIHKQLQGVHGNYAVDRSSVGHWAKWISAEAAHADLHDHPHTGRQQSAWTEANDEKVNSTILTQRCITVKELLLQLDTGEASVCRILNELGYSKVYTGWVL
jgi:hypothetical protein